MEAPTIQPPKQQSIANILTTISLQLLLWSSLFSLSIQISFFALHEVDQSLWLTDILCMAAAGTSLLVILIHILIARLQENGSTNWAKIFAAVFKIIILFFSCTAVLLWITTVTLTIILTLARQPTCRPANSDTHDLWRKGRVCYFQRAALVSSMLAFVISFVLCFTYNVSHDAFTAGLFGLRQKSVCLSPSDFQRSSPMAKRRSTLSFKCRSALLSPIAVSSPLRMSSPLRTATDGNYKEPGALDIVPSRPSIEKSPLLSKTPSLSHSSINSNDTLESSDCPHKTAYAPSNQAVQSSWVPTAYVPSPHAETYLHTPKTLPNTIGSALSPGSSPPQRAFLPSQRAPSVPQRITHAEVGQIETSSLYTSRRVSSTFLTPTSHMGPPLTTNNVSPERSLEIFPASPPVHMPLTRPSNLYSTRRAPTLYTHTTPSAVPAAQRRFPVAYPPSDYPAPAPMNVLAPPPSIRQLNSARRGVSYASNTSSVYSRQVSDEN